MSFLEKHLPPGVSVTDLPSQVAGRSLEGRELILDGDGPCYVVAAKYKTVATAVRHYQQMVLEAIFMAQAETATVHLTARGSLKANRHRAKAVQPYQGNRVGKPKPPLLEAIREAVAREENQIPDYTVLAHRDVEADDAMVMRAYQLKDYGVIRSGDKDLRMTPYPYYDESTGQVMAGAGFGNIALAYTAGGTVKGTGQGVKFFWMQMLMGDSADHVKGVRTLRGAKCGPAGAFEYLNLLTTQDAVANAVIDAYRALDQNPLPEGLLLWLLRYPGDTFTNYLREIAFSPANQAFLMDCFHRDWYDIETPAPSDDPE